MPTALVTGGTGFVGRRLVTALQARGWRVRVMTRRGGSGDDTIAYPSDGQFSAAQIGNVDAVCHLAAFIPPRMDDPQYAEECIRVNALQTLSLLRAAEGRVKTFVHLSSGNVYAPATAPRREGDLLYPDGRGAWYLTSKIAGEIYASALGKARAFRSVVLRPSSVYGPGMTSHSMMATFLARVRSGEPIQLVEGGAFGTDLVYVDDVVAVIVSSLELDVDGVFNVGSGVRTTSLQAARAICAATARSEDAIQVIGKAPLSRIAGFAALDVTRARQLLGYVPVTVHEGVRRWLAEEGSR